MRDERRFRPTRILDIDLAGPPLPPEPLEGYRAVRALVRLCGTPIGEVTMRAGRAVDAPAIRSAALEKHGWPILRVLLHRAIAEGGRERASTGADLARGLDERFGSPDRLNASGPTVTVAVCSRERAADLARCLDAIARLDPRPDEILVVDNAPTTGHTAAVVSSHPDVRYVCEPAGGLDRARNRAIRESRSAVIAFTDDDVVVDPGWVGAIRRAFTDYPGAAAVTGLVLPLEIETRAQQLFEEYGGFSRGFERRIYHVSGPGRGRAVAKYGGTGQLGTGANMAFRREIFDEVGPFDPALDVGTPTNGGGDLDMFFRVLRAGRTIVYEPEALVRHRHRREDDALLRQIANNGVGFYAYLCREAVARPDDRGAIIRLAAWWFLHWDVRRAIHSLIQPGRFQRDLSWAELIGSIYGPFRYLKSRDESRREIDRDNDPPAAVAGSRQAPPRNGSLVVHVDLGRPLEELGRAVEYRNVRVFVSWDGVPLGDVTIENDGEPVTAARLRSAIVNGLGAKLLGRGHAAEWLVYGELMGALHARLGLSSSRAEERLDLRTAVSVVLPTRNRPDDLARCLNSLAAQATLRPLQIVVVDNDPNSGLTAPVVARYPTVSCITERRPGLSYARNAGIAASRGAIVVTTDDDVVAPSDWIERLVAPFVDPEVTIVTGNVLPYALDTPSQADFEAYGGLGKGVEPKRVDGDWFWSFRGAVPTWELGATANAAFRASIFSDPDIGLFDEALGAGMPTGCSEDTYLFYRALKAGCTLVYEPRAFVWHRHRDDPAALRRQIFNYAKGHAAYQITTLLRDRDCRALARLLFRLPQTYWRRTRQRLRGESEYSLDLILREVLGTLAGPLALWRARRIVTRRGRSQPVAPMPHEVHDAVPMEGAAPQEAARELVVAVPAKPPRV